MMCLHRSLIDLLVWRVWNAAGSDGCGVIGVLEANFIAPAHDKQGFERTIGLSRLEARLVHFQKTYWDKISYAPRIRSNQPASPIKSSMGNVIGDTKGHTGNLSNINIGSYKRFIDTSTSPECPSADGITRGDSGMKQAQETVTKAYARIGMANKAVEAASQAKDSEMLGRLWMSFSQNAAASSIFNALWDKFVEKDLLLDGTC
ncbi:hypothetical protein Droror1_Dr00007528 [Drosera rotundifolia]